MSLDPLLSAAPVIQLHAFSAILAFLLGAVVLFGAKGTPRHRTLGRVWVWLMVVVSVSSFFIWEIRTFGLFSAIHLLSIGTLVALFLAVRFAIRHQIEQHRRTMQSIYLGALVIAGFFTFMPGRIMYRVIFGAAGANPASLGLALGVLGLVVLGALALIRANRRRHTRPGLTA